MHEILDSIYNNQIIKVISGRASGGDELGERWAKEHGHEIIPCEPDWKKYGRGAGFIRNTSMVDLLEEDDEAIGFWDKISTGTKDTINKLRKKSKNYIIFSFNGDVIFDFRRNMETLSLHEL